MKSLRKRAIRKALKYHARPLMEKYFTHEHAQAVGRSFLTCTEEYNLANSLGEYGCIAYRVFYDAKDYNDQPGWLKHLTDFS